MAELSNKNTEKAEEEGLKQGLKAEERQQGELREYRTTQVEQHSRAEKLVAENTDEKITSQHQTAIIPPSGDIKTVSPQLDEDDQQKQLSSEVNKKQDLQILLQQLQRERSDLLTQVERLFLTESAQVTDNTAPCHSCHNSSLHSLEETERMKSTLKSRRSSSPIRQPPVKGGTYDSELMRVLRERDEMQSILDKYERHLSEIQANIRVLTAERDKIKMRYQQAQSEITELRREVLRSMASQGSKYSVTAQSMLKRLEAERDEAMSNFHRMSTERDSLRERLKISQETAISERAHLEQRVEDLKKTLLTMEQERAELKSRQAQMKEGMVGLEEQVNTLSGKLATTDGELSCLKNECNVLRLSNTQTENSLSETQKRLINRIGDLQRVQKKNQHLEEKNESLQKELTVLREELNVLQNTVFELTQHRDTLQEHLERKNNLLCSNNKQLDEKENSIHNMSLQIEDLEASLQAVEETVSSRDRELDRMRRKLLDSEDELDAVVELKDATLRDNMQLREDMDQMCLDKKALQMKIDKASQEIEVLERKVQNYVSDISNIEDQLSSKERECKALQECQMQLRTSDSEKRRLRERVESLERSLQEAISAEQSCSAELKQLTSTIKKHEEELWQMQSKQLNTHHDLEKTRDLCVKLDSGKEAVQQELESCRSELELLRKQLASEREKELHLHLSSQERLVEIQLLRDKLAVAESKSSTQSREMAQIRTRFTLLESDIESTRRQLNMEREEREHAVKEVRRLGLSTTFSAPLLSSTMRNSLSPVHHSLSPNKSHSPGHLPHTTSDHLPLGRSPNRSVTFRKPYD
ncbi:testis-specific gene 10 protein isoform X1 [Tachysurus fulvidraco]|uniref:testis-specific gene 10 protein isoform X1 n=2 Tax=Tachysurus fulvidraco TaxID=1234273 RepID=UPI001FEFA98B|nr:testis-specific gene 10 protein isoform X1 [Tachysurus fulvidraco]